MAREPINLPSLKGRNDKTHLFFRQRLIDAAEGRLISVVEEFDVAIKILSQHSHTITVFGTARLAQDHPVCVQAYEVGKALANYGYAVVTGGGAGAMEAANHGAMDAGGASIGFNINLPHEQVENPYITEGHEFEHFFARKVCMTLDASGFVFVGGGFGTLDELFEIVTLAQTGKIPKVPIVLVGTDFWNPMDKYIRETLLDKFHTIDIDDLGLYTITDDIDEVVSRITAFSDEEAYREMSLRANTLEERRRKAAEE